MGKPRPQLMSLAHPPLRQIPLFFPTKTRSVPALTLGRLAEMLQCGAEEKSSAHTRETKESFEGAGGFFGGSLLIPNVFPPGAQDRFQETSCWTGGARREEAMFYIRTVNHSSLALYFSSRRFGLAERAAGQTEGGCVVELEPGR